MFRTYRFDWHEVITFEYGTDIHVLGRPYGNLLALRLKNGRILKALGTVSFQDSRLEDIERGLSRVVQSRRRFEMGRRRYSARWIGPNQARGLAAADARSSGGPM
jgi:hypothetical protein